MRISRSRLRILTLAATLATGAAQPALLGGIAHAYVIECDYGAVSVGISNKATTNVPTHVTKVDVAPGSSFSQSTTLTKISSVTAGINGTYTASAKANAIIAEASTSFSLQLSLSGTSTTQTSVSHSWTLNNTTSKDRTYALYYGTIKATGNYTYKYCNSSGRWGTTENGSFQSWTIEIYGSALCPRSNYGSTTIQYKALLAIGC